ncbi:MAG: zinc dependent phospholipase C family protein [Peptococcaceae bacterium]|nr:zinc dependent phospholipase C family protein [Peptococcaceae bacterium]
MVQAVVGRTIRNVTRIILTTLGPLQYFLDKPGLTHIYCLDDALTTLRNDGQKDLADRYRQYHAEICHGLLWADRSWKNASHYYRNPTEQTHALWPGALAEFQFYYQKYLVAAKREAARDRAKGMFYLGAALHLIQDMCVPHHAVGSIFNGHQEFEKWARQNYTSYPVTGAGMYLQLNHPSQWLDHNAGIAATYYGLVSDGDTAGYALATQALIPLTIRATAGFLAYAELDKD